MDLEPPSNFKDPAYKGNIFDLMKSGDRGIRGRLADAAFLGLDSTKKQIKNGVKKLPKKAGRTLRRVGVGAAGAIPLAMLATGAAAATGDPSKAAALAAAAGSAGYNFTNYYGDKLAKGAGNTLKSSRVGFWGDDLKKVEQMKFDKEFLESPELMNALTKTLGSREEAKKVIANGDVQAFLNSNITDPGKIAKALKRREHIKERFAAQGINLNHDQLLKQAVSIAYLNKNVNPGVFNPMSRERRALKDNVMKEYGVSENYVDQILQDLDYIES